MNQDVFVNYTNPEQQTDRSLRRRVARYIGTHYRNRSRPMSRLETGHRPGADFITLGIVPEQPGAEVVILSDDEAQLAMATLSMPRDHSGIRQDPFGAYPTRHNNTVGQAIDHCKSTFYHENHSVVD